MWLARCGGVPWRYLLIGVTAWLLSSGPPAQAAKYAGETLASETAQHDTELQVLYKDGVRDANCQERKVVMTEVTKRPAEAPAPSAVPAGPWTERWYIDRCGKLVAWDVSYTPIDQGSVEIGVRFADDFRDTSVPDQAKDRYQDGIVIWQNPDDSKVPFLLKFNINTQIRYLNTTDSSDTFTDHLGNVYDVNKRNDITVNRAMFILGGYMWDRRLLYSFTVWTSAGAASIIVAGNIGWRFNKGFTLTGGYTGVPGSRSLVNTFPFFTSSDRTMADNFFRPGFTQGIWGSGEPVKGLHYLAFVGNGLNTLNISATKIDTNLMYSSSVWWEPLGDYGEPGKSRNMYDDYFAQKKVRIRVGTAFTRSREDRFSNLDVSSPENTSLHNSDGVLTFSTGAFAPGVTVEKATYRMWAIDTGIKYNGLAINGQYFWRRLDDFEADGPLPLSSTFDHGFELVAGKFVIPRKLMAYVRGSMVFGNFNDSWEYAGGVKWHFLPTERLWLQGELMRVDRAPYSGTFTPYTSGLTGWVPMMQAVIAF